MKHTRQEIEAALHKVARIMQQHDRPQFAPILVRLKSELDALNTQDAGMALAKSILEDATQNRPTV